MTQLTLEGEDANAPICFDCPICGKNFELKVDQKHIYHRPWAFHISIDHGDFLIKHCDEDIPLWLAYYCFFDDETGEYLRRKINVMRTESTRSRAE